MVGSRYFFCFDNGCPSASKPTHMSLPVFCTSHISTCRDFSLEAAVIDEDQNWMNDSDGEEESPSSDQMPGRMFAPNSESRQTQAGDALPSGRVMRLAEPTQTDCPAKKNRPRSRGKQSKEALARLRARERKVKREKVRNGSPLRRIQKQASSSMAIKLRNNVNPIPLNLLPMQAKGQTGSPMRGEPFDAPHSLQDLLKQGFRVLKASSE
jgi:pyruvate/2-oxoglutarate dehydrogenase complex dihydrolipoamide acyltransferase (E2) component